MSEQFKRRIGAMLRRVERLGPRAYHTAISLLDNGLSLADIEKTAARKVPSLAPAAHGTTREPAQGGEGYPVPDALQIAVHKQFSDIARQAAAGRLYDDEGRKRFRNDALDQALFEQGAASARRLGMGK